MWGRVLATVIIHLLGIPSRGQRIPHRSRWLRHVPMEILTASAEVLTTVERKNPKLIPAKPMEIGE